MATSKENGYQAEYGDQRVGRGDGGETHQAAPDGAPRLTTQQGIVVSDDQNTLRSGVRGPAALEDFHFRQLAFDQPGSLSRHPYAARAVILAPDCPVRRHRVKDGLTGRRMRSAVPTLDPVATHQEIRRCEDDEPNAWRRGAGKGHAIAAPPCSRPS